MMTKSISYSVFPHWFRNCTPLGTGRLFFRDCSHIRLHIKWLQDGHNKKHNIKEFIIACIFITFKMAFSSFFNVYEGIEYLGTTKAKKPMQTFIPQIFSEHWLPPNKHSPDYKCRRVQCLQMLLRCWLFSPGFSQTMSWKHRSDLLSGEFKRRLSVSRAYPAHHDGVCPHYITFWCHGG